MPNNVMCFSFYWRKYRRIVFLMLWFLFMGITMLALSDLEASEMVKLLEEADKGGVDVQPADEFSIRLKFGIGRAATAAASFLLPLAVRSYFRYNDLQQVKKIFHDKQAEEKINNYLDEESLFTFKIVKYTKPKLFINTIVMMVAFALLLVVALFLEYTTGSTACWILYGISSLWMLGVYFVDSNAENQIFEDFDHVRQSLAQSLINARNNAQDSQDTPANEEIFKQVLGADFAWYFSKREQRWAKRAKEEAVPPVEVLEPLAPPSADEGTPKEVKPRKPLPFNKFKRIEKFIRGIDSSPDYSSEPTPTASDV